MDTILRVSPQTFASGENYSMLPLIFPSDKVVLKRSDTYRVNDVVAFLKGKMLIAHRIVWASPDGKYFVTKGDNNTKTDRIIASNIILGKVIAVRRGKRQILLKHLYLTQSTFYLSELAKISKILKRLGVKFIILRGIVVHLFFSGKPPERIYADCDVLVGANDFKKTTLSLQRSGYHAATVPLFGVEFVNASEVTLTKNVFPFPVHIDLHKSLGIPFSKLVHLNALYPKIPGFEKDMFKHVTKVRINREYFPLLSKEFLINYLFLHWYRHNFEGTHRVDLIRAIIESGLDFSGMLKVARQYEFTPIVYLSCLVMERYFGLEFPQKLFSELKLSRLKKKLMMAILPFLSPLKTGTRVYSGVKRVILIFILSPLPTFRKIRLMFSLKTLRFIPPTVSALILGVFTRPRSMRFISEDYAAHHPSPNSKTKSISL